MSKMSVPVESGKEFRLSTEEEHNDFILDILRKVNAVLLQSNAVNPNPSPNCPKASQRTSRYLREVFGEHFRRAELCMDDLLPQRQIRQPEFMERLAKRKLSADSCDSGVVDSKINDYENLLARNCESLPSTSLPSPDTPTIDEDNNNNNNAAPEVDEENLNYSAYYINNFFGKLPIITDVTDASEEEEKANAKDKAKVEKLDS